MSLMTKKIFDSKFFVVLPSGLSAFLKANLGNNLHVNISSHVHHATSYEDHHYTHLFVEHLAIEHFEELRRQLVAVLLEALHISAINTSIKIE